MKTEERDALERWRQFADTMKSVSVVDAFETPEARDARKAELVQDFAKFAYYYFPKHAQAEFAKWQLDQVRQTAALERGIFAWLIHREGAKSIIHGLFVPLWLMVRGELKAMLMCSYSEGAAILLLQPLRAALEFNERFIRDWGPFKNTTLWEAGAFLTTTGVSFRALGTGQSPRGVRNDEARPDYVLLDDIDEDEQSRNVKRVNAATDWAMGALFPAMSITGRARFVIIGNVIAKETVLERIAKQADRTMRVNLLDARGIPSWPARYTKEACEWMIKRMGYRMAQREYFHNPILEGTVFKKEWMQWKELPALSSYRALVAYLDPGFKNTATADSKAWILIGVHEGQYHIVRAFVSVASIKEMVGWGYELKAMCDVQGATVRLFMEEVFLQDLLYEAFHREAVERGAPLPLSGDKRQKPQKDARIEAISPHFERSNVYFNKAYENDHHMLALIEQLLNFQPGVKTHKDGPDALEGGIHILQQVMLSDAPITVGKAAKNRHRV